jgi:ABC-type uncharacterized transport system substrate-binding protein
MMSRFAVLALLVFACLASFAIRTAVAHPHVWVTMKSELVFAADGAVAGVRHAWTFDDMFSTFATQGIDSKVKGTFTREELAPLAEVNVTSLKEFDFFTFAKVNGAKAEFNNPVNYWLDFKDGVLTLNFTLPFKTPARAKNLDIEVYDPTYFVEFSLAEKDPVALQGAPARCRVAVVRPQGAGTQGRPLSESFFNSLGRSSSWGAQFANKISVNCP